MNQLVKEFLKISPHLKKLLSNIKGPFWGTVYYYSLCLDDSTRNILIGITIIIIIMIIHHICITTCTKRQSSFAR